MWNHLEGWMPGCLQQLLSRDDTFRRMASHVLVCTVLKKFSMGFRIALTKQTNTKSLNTQLCFTGLSQSEFKSQDDMGDFHIGSPSNSAGSVLLRFLSL